MARSSAACVGLTETTLTYYFSQQRPSEEVGLSENTSDPLMSSSALSQDSGRMLAVTSVNSRIRLPGTSLCPITHFGVILSGPLPTFLGFSVLVYNKEEQIVAASRLFGGRQEMTEWRHLAQGCPEVRLGRDEPMSSRGAL